MKPSRILFFILLVMGTLLSIAFFFPKEGIKISDDIVLHFPTIDELLESPGDNVVDISQIIAKNQVKEDILLDDYSKMKRIKMDDSSIIYYEPKAINADEVTRKIEFPGKDKSALYPFFKELSHIRSNGKLIRIMHYGDSQIEADRISSYLRTKIQGQFGGSGPGLISPVPPYGFDSPVKIDLSEGWLRYTGFGLKDTAVKHNRYGVLSSFSRFAPYSTGFSDSTENQKKESFISNIEYSAWLKINHSQASSANVKTYNQCRLFYGFNQAPINVKVFSGERELDKKILLPGSNLQVKQWFFDKTPEFLRMEFHGFDSPDIYALALDGMTGVAVDNIPLRGSSGLIFTSTNENILHAIYQNLNAKLIILQFGGNVAPTMKDNYDGYQQSFYSQLLRLKKLIPDVSIVVIGIADMSLKEKDKYVSYPNVPIIRDALKKAAFKANCAYWDTYEAMGGQNSMPSWVFADPPLAEKDFIHFSINGSRIIAQMFYHALMSEYNSYFNINIKNKAETTHVQYSSK